MKNKYAANCEGCGRRVRPGAGKLSKRNGRWVVECGCTGTVATFRDAMKNGPGFNPDPDEVYAGVRYERDSEMELARRERARDDGEYARGMADADRYRDNVRYMGEEYAAAEELAWELKDPDPYY